MSILDYVRLNRGSRTRSRPTGRTPRVLTVYQHLPHYRSEVFAELQNGDRIDWAFAADLESSDGSIPTIPPAAFRRFHRLRNHWRGSVLWQSQLLSLLREERFDAVVFLGDAAYLSTWLGAALCRVRGAKVLFWTIGWHRPDHGLRRLIRMRFYRMAHALLVYGETSRRIGVNLGYPSSRMTVVGNSTSTHIVDAAESDLPAMSLPPSGSDVVTAVIRLTALKGLHMLIRAAAELNGRGRNVVVVLAGAGPEAQSLRRLATSLKVDLRLVGPVYTKAALELIYDRTSVTVVPLNAGLTCIQSLSYGRPVITTDDPYKWAPESEAIRPGLTGAHYADGSVSSLADVIDEWLARMRVERDSVAAACKREVELHWTPGAQAAAISAAVVATMEGRCVGS